MGVFDFINQKPTEHFPAKLSSVQEILDFSEDCLRKGRIREELLTEYRLVIEEIVLKLIEKASAGSNITVETTTNLNDIYLKFGCPGRMITLEQENTNDYGGKIIEEYHDYLNQSYLAGVNYVVFSTTGSYAKRINVLFIMLAFVVAGILHLMFPSEILTGFSQKVFFYPLEKVYTQCMQALATPVVFLSTVTMVIKLHQKFEHNRKMKKLFLDYIITSLIAIGISICAWKIILNFVTLPDMSSLRNRDMYIQGDSMESFLSIFSVDNLVEIFQMTNPIPMLLLSVLMGFASCGVFGKEGTTVRHAFLALNSLFAKMLSIMYDIIPILVFVAVLPNLLKDTEIFIHGSLIVIFFLFILTALIFIFYMIRIRLAGISLKKFFMEYKNILLVNYLIGSNINALPYNKRMLGRKLRLSPGFLKEGLNLGCMVNMDGNALFISGSALLMFTACGIHVTPFLLFNLIMMIILLSIGAPNQPGSFLIGMVFIMGFVGVSSDLYDLVIIIEALMGGLYSFINSTGDIVTMMVLNEKYENKKELE